MDRSTGLRQGQLLAALALGINDRVRHAEDTAAGHGAAAPAALVALHEFLDGATIDRLRQVVGLTPSGAVRLVDKLAQAGLVRRGPGPDGRSVAVTLTRRGTAAAQRVLTARRKAADTVLAGLGDDEVESLTPLLERLLQELTRSRLAERGSGRIPTGGWLCRLCDFTACHRHEGGCPVGQVTQALQGRGRT